MSNPKRLVLFVEGNGDEDSAPVLVKRLLTEQNPWEHLFLDPNPFRVGGIEKVVRQGDEMWLRLLRAAAKRGNLGGVLLLLDGDPKQVLKKPFCATEVGRHLSQIAAQAGAGKTFSVCSVFARMEYESWLIAGVESLAGALLPDGRSGVRAGVTAPDGDLEVAPRDAKGWLHKKMVAGYK